jgi:hypothetical protein
MTGRYPQGIPKLTNFQRNDYGKKRPCLQGALLQKVQEKKIVYTQKFWMKKGTRL